MLLIIGAGESGIGAALLAKKLGMIALVSDANLIRDSFKNELISSEIDFEEGGHQMAFEITPEFVVKSPGISDQTEIIEHFSKNGVEIISEIEFAYRHCNAFIIGVTGSNGKTTTTNLIYHILVTEGKNVVKAGNVGYSFARALSQKNWEFVVLELSSFQLDGIKKFKPDIAVLLNITPDHLDRYQNSFEKYVASKFRITLNQDSKNHFIVYGNDEAIKNYLLLHPSNAKTLNCIPELTDSEDLLENNLPILNLNRSSLKGKHNAINALCAVKAAKLLDIADGIIQEAVNSFVNDPHRLEFVVSINGVDFINDSKATNVDSVFWALDAMKKRVVWIAGGQDKGNDYTVLEPLVKKKVSSLIAMGVDNRKLLDAFGKIIPTIRDTHNLEDAVKNAMECAQEGDVVLLSPACASFDLFKNYEDRGTQFKEAVRKLKVLQL